MYITRRLEIRWAIRLKLAVSHDVASCHSLRRARFGISLSERNIMQRLKFRLAVLWLLSGLFFVSSATAQTKLLRFPDIHGDKVVFTYAGDL